MTFLSIVVAVIVFGLLVFTHELGHFLAAKACGIGVIEFSLGMGPRIFSFTKGETKYSLKAIPFGGSCAMVGEDAAGGGEVNLSQLNSDEGKQEESLPDNSFAAKSVWARILTVAAGPLFNFIFAFIMGVIITAFAGSNPALVYNMSSHHGIEESSLQVGDIITEINGHRINMGADIFLYSQTENFTADTVSLKYIRNGAEQSTSYNPVYSTYLTGLTYFITEAPAEIAEISEGSPIAEAGVAAGDIITAIDGKEIPTGVALSQYFDERKEPGAPMDITYLHDGVLKEVTVTPRLTTGRSLGFSAFYYREDATFSTALKGGLDELSYGIRAVFLSLKMMVTGQVGLDNISGPVGIVGVIGDTITESMEENGDEGTFYAFLNVINISVLLAANLGVVNLLPFPALDGGRLLLLIVEAVTGKKFPAKIENMINTIGFLLLMVLMVVILFSDVFKLFI